MKNCAANFYFFFYFLNQLNFEFSGVSTHIYNVFSVQWIENLFFSDFCAVKWFIEINTQTCWIVCATYRHCMALKYAIWIYLFYLDHWCRYLVLWLLDFICGIILKKCKFFFYIYLLSGFSNFLLNIIYVNFYNLTEAPG